VAKLFDPLSTFVVFDDRIWNGPGRSKLVSPNPYVETVGGTVHAASSLTDLAHTIGVPAAALNGTVAEYNRAVKTRATKDLIPPRTTENSFTPFPLDAYPIEIPPFRAIPACVGITYTMGGIAIDADGRVLGEDEAVIKGLYATGATTAGIEGGPYAGSVGGLARAAIFGLRAAEAAHVDLSGRAAKQLRQERH
jgi:fumarate reductase flavoprotein subunit